MRMRVLPVLAILLLASGCGQSPMPAPAATGYAARAAAAKPELPREVSEALARFAKFERRKVNARLVPMSDGRSAAELSVRLSAADKALLVQLYRLFPRPIEPEAFPEGLVARSREHLTTLYRFKFPERAPLDPARLDQEMMTRVYRDGEGTILAYESWMPGDDYQIFGKYDLEGRILKVDIESWEN